MVPVWRVLPFKRPRSESKNTTGGPELRIGICPASVPIRSLSARFAPAQQHLMDLAHLKLGNPCEASPAGLPLLSVTSRQLGRFASILAFLPRLRPLFVPAKAPAIIHWYPSGSGFPSAPEPVTIVSGPNDNRCVEERRTSGKATQGAGRAAARGSRTVWRATGRWDHRASRARRIDPGGRRRLRIPGDSGRRCGRPGTCATASAGP